jgi:hypothetical protein
VFSGICYLRNPGIALCGKSARQLGYHVAFYPSRPVRRRGPEDCRHPEGSYGSQTKPDDWPVGGNRHPHQCARIDRRATAGDVASASDRGGIREPRRSINLGGETPQRAGERPQRWAATEGKSCMRSYSSRERAGAAPDCQLLSQSASATPKIVFGGFAWWQAEN